MKNISARDKILEVARCLAQTKGYNAFSYRDLAAEVGIKTSSIHYYFPKKEDLALALIKQYRNIFAGLIADIDAQKCGPVSKFHKYLELFLDTVREGEKVCLGGMLASEILAFGKGTRLEVQGFITDNETWLEKLIQEGIKLGVFKINGPPASVARDVFAALEGAMLIGRTFNDWHRLEQLGTRLEELLTRET